MKIAEVKNLGPVTAGWLEEIGVSTLEELKKRDIIDIYAEIKLQGHPVSKNLITGLYGAIHEIDWRMIDKETKLNLYNKIDELIKAKEKEE